jgi:hypothetical protein
VNAQETRLFGDLVGALAERFSKAGHPMAFVTQEHRGLCPPYECGPTCIRLRALLLEACDLLEAEMQQPQQIDLFGSEVAG